MSDLHGAAHDGIGRAERLAVWPSLARAIGFGAVGASAGALALPTSVVITGWELGFFAILVGLLVGWSISAATPSVPTSWVWAISVLLTLFGLMLSDYLLLWQYHDDAGNPVPVPLADGGRFIWNRIYREPERLLLWGFTMLLAAHLASRSAPEAANATDAAGATAPPDGDLQGQTLPVVHLATVSPHPLRAADFDLFAVLHAPTEGVTLRRVQGVLSDLPGALPHLFDPDPDVAAGGGDPLYPRRVEDQAFATLDLAKEAAQAQVKPVDPQDWVDGDTFRSTIDAAPGFRQSLRPSEQRVGTRGRVAVGIAGVAIFAAVMVGGGRLKTRMGLEAAEFKDTLPLAAFDVVNVVLAGALAIATGTYLARVLARQHFARVLAAAASAADVEGTDSDQAPAQAPDHLVVRPRSLPWWCASWVGAALLCVVLGVLVLTGPNPEPALLPILSTMAVACSLTGALALRWAIVADRDGLVLTKAWTARRIPWADLEGIELVFLQAEITLGFHQLALTTRGGRRLTTPFAGLVGPGAPLPQLRETLLAMRDKHLAGDLSTDQSATAPEDTPTDAPARLDRVSAAAFALSLLGAVIVAVPLAVWGLLRTGPAHQRRGGAFAVAALSISATWVVAASTLIVVAGPGGTPLASTEPGGGSVATPTEPQRMVSPTRDADPAATPAVSPRTVFWADLRPGMCIPFPLDPTPDVALVDCTREHQVVMGRATLAGPAAWPGWERVDEAAHVACRPVFEEYMGVPFDGSRWWVDYLTVDEADWAAGKRMAVCLVWDPSLK